MTAEIGGVVRVDPTEEQLRSMRPGDRFFIAPCASKPDQFGEEHCHFPFVIELSGTPGSAGAAIRDILLERPCHGDARRTMPLFATADGRPYTYSTLNRLLHQLMAALFGEGIASTLSWHSFRIWLAIALREAGCPDEIVQLICRWQCRESLQAYAQIGIQRNLHWTNRAEKVQVQVMRTGALPALDNEDALARLNDDTSSSAAPFNNGPARLQQPPGRRHLRPSARHSLRLVIVSRSAGATSSSPPYSQAAASASALTGARRGCTASGMTLQAAGLLRATGTI